MMTFEDSIREQFKSKVYNALEDIAMDYPDIPDELHKEAMENAVEWFLIRFYEKG